LVVETERVAELNHVEVLALGKAETVLAKVVAQLGGVFDDLTTVKVVFFCVGSSCVESCWISFAD